MIDEKKRQDRIDRKERVRKRMRVEVDPEKYIYYPAKKPIDYLSAKKNNKKYTPKKYRKDE